MILTIVSALLKHDVYSVERAVTRGWGGAMEWLLDAAWCIGDPITKVIACARVGVDDIAEYTEHSRYRYGDLVDLSGLIPDPAGTNYHKRDIGPHGEHVTIARRMDPITYADVEYFAASSDAILLSSGDVANFDTALLKELRAKHPEQNAPSLCRTRSHP